MATGVIAAGLTGLMSCTDGYEPTPVENFTIDYVFSTTDSVGKQAVNYLNYIYTHLKPGHNRVGSDYLDAATDDATSLYYDESQVYKLATGRYTASNRIGDDMDWNTYYQTIREATIFIANIDRVPFNLTYVKGDEQPDEDGNLCSTSRCLTSTTTSSCPVTHSVSVSTTSFLNSTSPRAICAVCPWSARATK